MKCQVLPPPDFSVLSVLPPKLAQPQTQFSSRDGTVPVPWALAFFMAAIPQ